MNAALAIIVGTVAASALVGLYAGRRMTMNLENWTVGGRRFGIILTWLLMAGEVYTTFTFLGASGWAYTRGAPTYYILIYGTLAYTLSFFILPELWEVGRRHGLHTQSDFFRTIYRSRALSILVAVIGIASILPYLQLQLTGLGLIVTVASGAAISAHAAMVLAFVLTCAFVFTSGIRGTAWVSVIKDILMIVAVGVVGFGVPTIYFGGFGPMFRAVAVQFPGHLVFPGSTTQLGVAWVMSTVLLTAFGFYMWPHFFGTVFSARSAGVIRRNAIIMPFYQLPVVLVLMVGFAALLELPGLKNGDLAFLTLVSRTYPSWFLGVVGAAGAVTAMVPASILVLAAATLLAKNVYQAGFNPGAGEETVIRLSRFLVLLICAAALMLALFFPRALVDLLLIGYDGVAQFFPGVVLGLFWKRVTRAGVMAGMLAGIALAAGLVFGGRDPLWGLNAGFVALAVNGGLAVLISILRPDRSHSPKPSGLGPSSP